MHSPHDDRRPSRHLRAVTAFEPVGYPPYRSPDPLDTLCSVCAAELHDWRSPGTGNDWEYATEPPHPLQDLANLVGGLEALASLDATPLPDEPFAWTGVPGELVPLFEDLVPWLDGFADEVLTVEHRTALRRCAAHVANRAPGALTKKGSLTQRAGAVAWIVLRANDDLGPGARLLTGRALSAWFGLASDIAPRARTMLSAVGGSDRWAYHFRDRTVVGEPGLLTARRRRQIIADRDRQTR